MDNKKAGSEVLPARKGETISLDVGFGLTQTLDTIAGLPLTTLLEQIDALEALQDVALND